MRRKLPRYGRRRRLSKAEKYLRARIGGAALAGIEAKKGPEAIQAMARVVERTLRGKKLKLKRKYAKKIKEAAKQVPFILREPERIRPTDAPRIHGERLGLRRNPRTGRAEIRVDGRTVKVVGWKVAKRWLSTAKYWRRVKRLSAELEIKPAEARRILKINRDEGNRQARRFLKSREFKRLSKSARAKVRRKLKNNGDRTVSAYLEAIGVSDT